MPWETQNAGGFTQIGLYNAFYEYERLPIEESLIHRSGLVRLLAILDRRVGKRRLLKIREDIAAQPEWLQPFYRLRLEAEGLRLKDDTKSPEAMATGLKIEHP